MVPMNITALYNQFLGLTAYVTKDLFATLNYSLIFEDSIGWTRNYWTSILRRLENPSQLFEFSDLQLLLLKVFLFIFVVNLLLLAAYWRKYGTVITDRFIRQSTHKEIEELKLSVAKLKLPKEHSFRL